MSVSLSHLTDIATGFGSQGWKVDVGGNVIQVISLTFVGPSTVDGWLGTYNKTTGDQISFDGTTSWGGVPLTQVDEYFPPNVINTLPGTAGAGDMNVYVLVREIGRSPSELIWFNPVTGDSGDFDNANFGANTLSYVSGLFYDSNQDVYLLVCYDSVGNVHIQTYDNLVTTPDFTPLNDTILVSAGAWIISPWFDGTNLWVLAYDYNDDSAVLYKISTATLAIIESWTVATPVFFGGNDNAPIFVSPSLEQLYIGHGDGGVSGELYSIPTGTGVATDIETSTIETIWSQGYVGGIATNEIFANAEVMSLASVPSPSIIPPAGSLSLEGAVPSIQASVERTPGTVELFMSGVAPVINQTGATIQIPNTFQYTLSGVAPTISYGPTFDPNNKNASILLSSRDFVAETYPLLVRLSNSEENDSAGYDTVSTFDGTNIQVSNYSFSFSNTIRKTDVFTLDGVLVSTTGYISLGPFDNTSIYIPRFSNIDFMGFTGPAHSYQWFNAYTHTTGGTMGALPFTNYYAWIGFFHIGSKYLAVWSRQLGTGDILITDFGTSGAFPGTTPSHTVIASSGDIQPFTSAVSYYDGTYLWIAYWGHSSSTAGTMKQIDPASITVVNTWTFTATGASGSPGALLVVDDTFIIGTNTNQCGIYQMPAGGGVAANIGNGGGVNTQANLYPYISTDPGRVFGRVDVSRLSSQTTSYPVKCTSYASTAKRYVEFVVDFSTVDTDTSYGLGNASASLAKGYKLGDDANSLGFTQDEKVRFNGGYVEAVSAGTIAVSDVIGIAWDTTTNEVKFYKNNSLVYTVTSANVPVGPLVPMVSLRKTHTVHANSHT